MLPKPKKLYLISDIVVRGPTHIGVKVRTNAILLLIVLDRVIGSENQEGATLAPLSNFFYKPFWIKPAFFSALGGSVRISAIISVLT